MDHELSRKPKSIDYIASNESLALVEFTDLYSQQNDIIKQTGELYESNFSNRQTRKINKKNWGTIQKELTDKYKDTCLIIEEMQKTALCVDLKAQYQDNLAPRKYWVIVAPFHPDIEEGNKEDLMRFLEKLKDNITTSLPKAWNVRVKIISINNFAMPKSR